MLRRWIQTILCVGCLQIVQVLANEIFEESLHIKPLVDGKVYTHFKFKTLLENAVPRLPSSLSLRDERRCFSLFCNQLHSLTVKAQHHVVFPLTFGQILRQYAVTELHLSLNAGKWNYDTWGYPNDSSVGSGAELWVWMGEDEIYTYVFEIPS